MIKYIKLFLRSSKLILLLLVGITVYLGWRAAHIRFDFAMESLFRTGSREREDYEWFRRNFGSDDGVIFVGTKAPDVLTPRMREYFAHLAGRLAKIDGVLAVYSIRDAFEFYRPYVRDEKFIEEEIRTNPLFRGNVISEDGRTTCLWVVFRPEVDTEEKRARLLESLRAVLAEEEQASGLRFHSAGIPVIEHEYVSLTRRDITIFLPLAIGVFFLLLCIYFRNGMGVFLPLLSVGMGVIWTVGLMVVFGYSISILSSILPSMILIVSIADAIHILSHYREQGLLHADKREALAHTIVAMVPACFLVAFTTAVGFASLASTDVYIVNEFGLLTAAGVMVAWFVTVQFLPASLDNLPPFRARMFDAFATQFSDRMMDGIAAASHRHKKWILVVTLAVVGVSAWGITKIKRESSWLHDLRPSNPVHQAHGFFERDLSPVLSVDLILRAESIHDLEFLRKAEAFQRRIEAWHHPDASVKQTLSYVDLIKEINRARILKKAVDRLDPRALLLAKDPSIRKLPETREELDECLRLYASFPKEQDLVARLADEEGKSLRISVRIRDLNSSRLGAFMAYVREEHGPYAKDFGLMPTGKSWLAKKAMDSVVSNMISSTGLAALVIFASMLVLFRSLKVGLISIIPNFLPMAVTAGAMGFLDIPLNFTTVTIFSIVLGIAVDTSIHYLARVRMEVAQDGDHVAALYRTMRGTGRAMIFSTLLLVLGFGSILTSSFKFTFYFGLLGGIGLLSALICDLFVTPSLMVVFKPKVGDWARCRIREMTERVTAVMRKK